MQKKTYFMAAALAWLTSFSAHATDVEISGLFNGKILVSINSGSPRMLAVGETREGVKLISANSAGAVLEIDGKKQSLGLGHTVSTATAAVDNPSVKLEADTGGHYLAYGSINGRPVTFLVDTGATWIAISRAQAEAIGIDLRRADRSAVATASGFARSYSVKLDTVKVGSISLNLVDAVVIDNMPGDVALLGNSFLSRLDLKREGTVLTLTKKY